MRTLLDLIVCVAKILLAWVLFAIAVALLAPFFHDDGGPVNPYNGGSGQYPND
jgi:hypothetical protein